MDLIAYLESAGVQLKHTAGGEYKCKCILHPDTKPSMFINPEKQQWFCFGCGQGGGLVQLIMLHERVSFRDALAKAGTYESSRPFIPIAKQETLTEDIKQRLTTAAFQYEKLLDKNRGAWDYLTWKRNLDPVVVMRNHIGYCPAIADGLDVDPPLGDGTRPTLADRITIPEMDNGSCLYFQGRQMGDKGPKYMGLHGLPKPLYGFGRFKDERTLYLVEGPFDWLTLLQWGLPAVSSLGCYLSPYQTALLSDRRVVLAQDADLAGDLAAEQIARTLQNTTRLRPPEPFKDWNEALVAGWKRDDFLAYEQDQLGIA